MAHLYLDADAQIKFYLLEKGSQWVRQEFSALDDRGNPLHFIYTVDVSIIEVCAAVAAAHRAKRIDEQDKLRFFKNHLKKIAESYTLIRCDPVLQIHAAHLTQRHSLKALDAIHLAAALRLNQTLIEIQESLTLISGDHQVLTAAKAEGLSTENPNDHE